MSEFTKLSVQVEYQVVIPKEAQNLAVHMLSGCCENGILKLALLPEHMKFIPLTEAIKP